MQQTRQQEENEGLSFSAFHFHLKHPVESFMECVKDSLANENSVYLRGFGSFIVKKRAEKVARNIREEVSITIPAHSIPAFKPSKSFVAQVKENIKK